MLVTTGWHLVAVDDWTSFLIGRPQLLLEI